MRGKLSKKMQEALLRVSLVEEWVREEYRRLGLPEEDICMVSMQGTARVTLEALERRGLVMAGCGAPVRARTTPAGNRMVAEIRVARVLMGEV